MYLAHVFSVPGDLKMLVSLELELQVVVCHPTWMLGIELRLSGKVTNVLNNRIISPTHILGTFFMINSEMKS